MGIIDYTDPPGPLDEPPRVFIYGPKAAGKTTLASGAPEPLFLSLEAGDGQITGARKRVRFERASNGGRDRHHPNSYEELLAALRQIRGPIKGVKTLVIDGFQRVEELCAPYVCANATTKGGASIEWKSLKQPGYGEGEAALFGEMRNVLKELEQIWLSGLGVVATCHSHNAREKNPLGEDFIKYSPALCSQGTGDVAGLFIGWFAVVGFLKLETSVIPVAPGSDKLVARGTGRRLLHLRLDPAFAAGCRYKFVPPEIALPSFDSWATFWDHVLAGDKIRRELEELLGKAPPDKAKAMLTWVQDSKRTVAEIAAMIEQTKNSLKPSPIAAA